MKKNGKLFFLSDATPLFPSGIGTIMEIGKDEMRLVYEADDGRIRSLVNDTLALVSRYERTGRPRAICGQRYPLPCFE